VVDGGALTHILAWLEPRALLLALCLPPLIRIVGHWIPEELFMVAMGVLAARADSAPDAAVLLGAVTLSHFLSDQVVYLVGRWLHPKLERFPRLHHRLMAVTARIESSPAALIGLIPARVLPLGRAAWLAGCGVVRIPWVRFAAVDAVALGVHLLCWSGLGWWLAGDLRRLEGTAETGRLLGVWVVVAVLLVLSVVMIGRRWSEVQPVTTRTARRIGRSIRHLGRNR
jgi:membrane protein DedA with SNARE-associated domain